MITQRELHDAELRTFVEMHEQARARMQIDQAYQRGYDDGASDAAPPAIFTGLFIGAAVVGVLCWVGNALGVF